MVAPAFPAAAALLLPLLLLLAPVATALLTDSAQVAALCDLYALGGSLWAADPCGWSVPCFTALAGVTCSNGRVTQLNLGTNGFNGTIPSAIGNLTSLSWLYLANNQLSGTLPETISNLASLKQLCA
eukprot:m51a1_g4293 putative two component regulator (127) ;mRNA; f:409551-410636